ncbi:unnamed protein product [Urochloa humidicola]
MEPNKQSDAADLEDHLDAIAERVGGPSSPPLLNPQQQPAAPVERPPPPHMPQSPPKEVAPTATLDMLQPQPEALNYGGVELSPGNRIRRNTRVWLWDTAPAARNPSVASKRSELNVNAEEFHPTALSHPSVVQSSSTPSFSAIQGQTSATAPRSLTLEEDEALRRVRQLVPGDVGSAGSSACLVRLLKEGCDVVRKGVLDGVKGALHFIMGSPEWRDVFVELLREGSFDELRVIVDVACKSDSLLSVADADDECGVESLKELFKAVEQHPLLLQDIINCLVNDGLFYHSRGPDLLRSIFTTLSREDSSVIIDHGLRTFRARGVFLSKFESDSMVECLAVARRPDLEHFEELILSKTVEFAKGSISNHFLQRVLERGRDQLKANITQRVVQNLVSLSMHWPGCFVVQACFVQTGSVRKQLLQRVLEGFQGLSLEELDRLVQDSFAANHVVSKLLLHGKADFLAQTKALEQRIQTLPLPAGKVMEAVREVLS